MLELLQGARPIIMKVLVGVLAMLFIKLSKRFGIELSPDEVKSVAMLGGALIVGIGLHFAAKSHAGIMMAPATSGRDGGTGKASAGGAGGGAIALILLFGVLGLVMPLGGCGGLNKRWVETWQKSERALVADLSAYIQADPKKAGDVGLKELSGIQAHLANVEAGLSSVAFNEETELMAELLSYIQADTKLSDARKLTRADLIKAHLDDYNSLRR